MKPLNLASQPFRNEKLPKLGLSLATLLVLLLTAYHARAVVRLLPRNTSKLAAEVNTLEGEEQRLRADASRLRSTRADPGDVARWSILKDLVDRKVFSWTRLFGVLEESLPRGVRLMSVSPSVQKGQFVLELQTIAQTMDDGLELIQALEERPEFENVFPRSRNSTEQGVMFNYSMVYNPPPPPSPAPVPSGSPTAAPDTAPSPAASPGEQP